MTSPTTEGKSVTEDFLIVSPKPYKLLLLLYQVVIYLILQPLTNLIYFLMETIDCGGANKSSYIINCDFLWRSFFDLLPSKLGL